MRKNGFTLIELLIVLAVLGILGSMVYSVITGNSLHSSGMAPYMHGGPGLTVEHVDANSAQCVNHILLRDAEPIVKDGAAVKC